MGMTELALMFAVFSANYDLPKGLLSSLCFVESSHKIRAIHVDDGNGNSLGVCQIKLSTAKMLGFQGSEKELMKPEVNIKYSAKYLRNQITRYDGDVRKGIAAYNSGSYKAGKKGLPVNQHYVDKVFKAWGRQK